MRLQLLTPPGTRTVPIKLDDTGPWISVYFFIGFAEITDPRLIKRLVNCEYARVVGGGFGGAAHPVTGPGEASDPHPDRPLWN
jgi:hypothetical protein